MGFAPPSGAQLPRPRLRKGGEQIFTVYGVTKVNTLIQKNFIQNPVGILSRVVSANGEYIHR